MAAIIVMFPVMSYAACTSPAAVAGAREWFVADDTYKFCDGTNWIDFNIDENLTACATTSQMEYDTGEHVYKFCDGAEWKKAGCIPACDTTPTTYSTGATYTYYVPTGCNSVTIEVYGAGGSGSVNTVQRGAGGGGGASAVVRNTGTVLLAAAGGGGGGGGVEGAFYSSSRGGGGGYATATASVSEGEQLNVYVGDGASPPVADTGGAGGGFSPYQGGKGGNRRQNGTAATYGGAGGGGAENSGANSTYGGAGGRGDDGGICGTSTNGGACSNQHGGGGGGYSSSGGTVTTGGNGGAGAGTAANSGPGSGASGAVGGDGRVVITPSGPPGPCCPDLGTCSSAGLMEYSVSSSLLTYCNGLIWISLGPTITCPP